MPFVSVFLFKVVVDLYCLDFFTLVHSVHPRVLLLSLLVIKPHTSNVTSQISCDTLSPDSLALNDFYHVMRIVLCSLSKGITLFLDVTSVCLLMSCGSENVEFF